MPTKDERDRDRRGLAKIKVGNSGETGDFGAYAAAKAALRYLDDLDAKDEEIARLSKALQVSQEQIDRLLSICGETGIARLVEVSAMNTEIAQLKVALAKARDGR